MIGSLLTGALALVLGFAYPAYECFKTVELNRPEVEQLRFWCQYWILVAALTVLERVGDAFISWIPMYSEAKVAFFIYLWYPKTRGATYVYDTFLRPYIASRETEIDRNLLELKTRAGDVVFLYWQKAASYGQTRVFEILQYIASQAPSEQSRQQAAMQRQPVRRTRQAPASAPAPAPAMPAQAVPASTIQPLAVAAALQIQQTNQEPTPPSEAQPSSDSTTRPETASKPESKENEIACVDSNSLPPHDTPMEEAIRMTRGRLRRRNA